MIVVSSSSVYHPAMSPAKCKDIDFSPAEATDESWKADLSVSKIEGFLVVENVFNQFVYGISHFGVPQSFYRSSPWIELLNGPLTDANLKTGDATVLVLADHLLEFTWLRS